MNPTGNSLDSKVEPKLWLVQVNSTAQADAIRGRVAVDPISHVYLVLDLDSMETTFLPYLKTGPFAIVHGNDIFRGTALTSESPVPPIDTPNNNTTDWIDPFVDFDKLHREIEASFKAAQEQYFEDGMESTFSRKIVGFITHHGKEAIEVMRDLIGNEKVGTRAAEEALRWLAHIEHPASYEARRALCEQSLGHSSMLVRDAAALGLASLDDWHGIPALKEAIARETCPALREDMKDVLDQLLEARSRAASPQENP
ncbi:MAG: hypothetical protein HYZ50_12520 [Deltaproteobacteria bacterium]|nr:hypothetical protein [Deltaproteobacteria bacterium]